MNTERVKEDIQTKVGWSLEEDLTIVTAAGWKLFYNDQSILLNESTGDYASMWYAVHSLTGAAFLFETDEGTEDMVLDPRWAAQSCLCHLVNKDW